MKQVLLGLSLLSTLSAMAGGYEKAVMWSGKWGALGGAAVGAVNGADAVFFNPAGVVKGPSSEISLNVSAASAQFNGPGVANNVEIDGEKTTSLLPGFLYKKNISEKSAYGIGLSAIAGSKALHENVGALSADQSTNIQAAELSLVYAQQMNKNLSVGFGWRVTDVKASFDSISTLAGGTAVKAENLNNTDYGSFRLGFQYEADTQKWGWGATYRSEVSFTLEDGETTVRGGVNGSGEVEARSTLPQSLAFGTWYQMNEKSKLYTEITWYNYAANEEIKLDFSNTSGTAAAIDGVDPAIEQHWKDMYALKIGYEYMKDETLALRAGFALTTQVTNDDYARNTFSAPGNAYSAHVGMGKTFGQSTIDLGLEYVTSSGEGNANGTKAFAGDYESYAYSLHTGYKYAF